MNSEQKKRFVYRDLFGDMPPKKHDVDPYRCEVIRFIDDVYTGLGAPRSIEDCVKAFETARKASPPIIAYNRTLRVWVGWNHPMALKSEIAALNEVIKRQDYRLKLIEKEVFGEGHVTTPTRHPRRKRFS